MNKIGLILAVAALLGVGAAALVAGLREGKAASAAAVSNSTKKPACCAGH